MYFRSDCGFGFHYLITEARGREKHENSVSRACIEGIVQTSQKQQTPTNHKFWKLLAASAFPLMLENISKAGLQKKTCSVGNCNWGSGEREGAGTEAAHAVLKDSLQSLPFLPLCQVRITAGS